MAGVVSSGFHGVGKGQVLLDVHLVLQKVEMQSRLVCEGKRSGRMGCYKKLANDR